MQQIFVVTKVLDMTKIFCHDKQFYHDKSFVAANKTFVVTKIILVAVPANDNGMPRIDSFS